MVSSVFIGLTFASASDRDGVSVAKFDVKSDRGATSIEVRPTLGELLNDDATKTTSQPYGTLSNPSSTLIPTL